MGIISIFLCQEGTVTYPFLKITFHRDISAGNPRILAKLPKFLCIRPGKVTGGSIYLVEAVMDAAAVILHKPLKVACGFHGGGQGSGIMIPHMYPGLIDISCPHKGGLFLLQHYHGLSPFCTKQRCIKSVQPRSDNDL